MHSLTELRQYFQQNKIQIKESCGWYFKCNQDTWTMLDDIFYLNNNPVTKKQVAEYAKNAPKKRFKPKMIRANKGFNYDDSSIEVSDE